MQSRPLSLDEALTLARAGDEVGYRCLWRCYQPQLLRFLYVLVGPEAEDVASETWLQMVRDLRRFRGGVESFGPWLFGIGRHRAIDVQRARARRRSTPWPLEHLADLHDAFVAGADEQAQEHEETYWALQLVASLPAEQAQAVALRVIAGFDAATIGRLLGKSAGSVRVSVHRGLRTLARAMEAPAPVTTRGQEVTP